GGIMPDVFVPLDTTHLSDYFLAVRAKGCIIEMTHAWADKHRTVWSSRSCDEFLRDYPSFGIDSLFHAYALERGLDTLVAGDTNRMRTTLSGDTIRLYRDDANSRKYLGDVLRANVARNLYGYTAYFDIMRKYDNALETALRVIEGKKE
ncbi:MAG: hypothetical protein SPJ13_08720, partial [Bacteroidales bacterium]|nr:hypothetical protein [Bacteroidales bacterium]